MPLGYKQDCLIFSERAFSPLKVKRQLTDSSLLLDMPFIPDRSYSKFLQKRVYKIHSFHFAFFPGPTILNARQDMARWSDDTLVEHLQPFSAVKKYALLNSRFLPAGSYFNDQLLNSILASLAQFIEETGLTGIVFTDFYLLQALSKQNSEVCGRLEAVPGINCMLDSFDKIASHLTAISHTSFKQPGKIILDRSLNRRLDQLGRISSQCRKHFPGMALELLANEGCLYQCPFKLSHDSQISHANLEGITSGTYQLNQKLGCINVLAEEPELLFKSPFIRPEDCRHYQGMVEIIKICGRTLGPDFLKRVAAAYIKQSHQGNLLDLLDTMEWLAANLSIDNQLLPDDFFTTVTSCNRRCGKCGYCRDLLQKTAVKKQFSIKKYL